MTNYTIIGRVLQKYGFLIETPPEVRKRITEVKPVLFKKIKRRLRTQTSTQKRIWGINMKKGIASAAAVIIIGGALITAGILYLDKGVLMPPSKATVTFVIGDVSLVRDGELLAAPAVNSELIDGDQITTEENSKLVAQIGSTGVVTVLPESMVTMTSIAGRDNTSEISLAFGRLYSKIVRSDSHNYRVNTPVAIAAVRGTGFLTRYDRGITTVDLLEGKVSVTPLEAPEKEKTIEAGSSASVSAPDRDVRVKNLTDIEKRELEIYHLAPFIEDLKSRTSKEIIEIFEAIEAKETEIKSAIRETKARIIREWRELPPLDRLRSQDKALSMLHLRGGEQIAGNVVGREGDDIVLDTGDGVIKIPAERVIRRLHID